MEHAMKCARAHHNLASSQSSCLAAQGLLLHCSTFHLTTNGESIQMGNLTHLAVFKKHCTTGIKNLKLFSSSFRNLFLFIIEQLLDSLRFNIAGFIDFKVFAKQK
ncbi:hypothetical protein ILYODFUR_029491 [Ilyodon furcidens]|uniref:Uncharacterized protein n=1 Tax=Ilyodon furcidens TaxID=33524 RepID=A0ABV0SQ76_9TELE